MIQKRCLHCGKVFKAKLDRAKFCGGSCRAAWATGARNVVDRRVADVADALTELETYLDTPDMWRDNSRPELAQTAQRLLNLAREVCKKEAKS
jgi:hypothetical protein